MIDTSEALATVEQVWIEAPGVAVVHMTGECLCAFSFHVEANGDGFDCEATCGPFCGSCEAEWEQYEAAALLIGMGALLV